MPGKESNEPPSTRQRKAGISSSAGSCDCSAAVNSLTILISDLKNKLEACHKIIQAQDKNIQELTNAVNQIKTNQSQQIENRTTNNTDTASSYSQVLKGGLPKPQEQTLLVKAQSDRDSKNVLSELTTKIKPDELKVGVRIAKTSKDGNVLLKCNNSSDLEKVKLCIVEKMGDKVTVEVPTKVNPRIKVCNIYKNLHEESNDNIVQKILAQNDVIKENCSLKFVYKSKILKNFFFIILEVDPVTYNALMGKGTLSIGWGRCQIRDHVSITRCYKCCKFGHIASNCNLNYYVCPLCSEHHTQKECKSEIRKCVNCCELRHKKDANVSVDHSVFDKECHFYNKIRESQRNKISYYST